MRPLLRFLLIAVAITAIPIPRSTGSPVERTPENDVLACLDDALGKKKYSDVDPIMKEFSKTFFEKMDGNRPLESVDRIKKAISEIMKTDRGANAPYRSAFLATLNSFLGTYEYFWHGGPVYWYSKEVLSKGRIKQLEKEWNNRRIKNVLFFLEIGKAYLGKISARERKEVPCWPLIESKVTGKEDAMRKMLGSPPVTR